MRRTMAITLTALMAAVICLISPFSIYLPITAVPISLGSFAVALAAAVLGWRLGCASVFIYLLLGMAGLPVFSGFSGGIAKVAGPTGGYLVGYLFLAVLTGLAVELGKGNLALTALGMFSGTAACYVCGTVWLAWQGGMEFYQALLAGVIPFIPGDIAKMILALLAAAPTRRAVQTRLASVKEV